MSACNPPCAAGETCTAAGECLKPPPVAVAPPPGAVDQPATGPADPGWAQEAGLLGIVSGVAVLGFAIGSEVTKEDQIPSLPLGIGATVITGVAGPVTAIGAASAREGGNVKGSQGLRITGWIAYGLTLADAMILIALGANDTEPPDGVIVSVGALGAASLSCFASDAFLSAAEAEQQRAAPAGNLDFTLAPVFSVTRAADDSLAPTLGLRGGFL